MSGNVLRAIFKRNLSSYFSSPTGYVFICVFVLLSSLAAFWPNEFFNANLANLDQLNKYFPYIMLVFIPAITMGIWSEERRQGTDELLLTIPAGDFEVVLGKFLAALAIYSISLGFSMFSNICVLGVLGQPDWGLLVSTYIGYWFVGLAMLSIGMVASFLTGNLTVAFVLGAIFNAPLAFSGHADVIVKNPTLAAQIRSWSLAEQFADFERGVISLSSVSYFVLITVVMLYLSVVLIGRRHWRGGRDGSSMLGHYLTRTLALLAIAIGASVIFSNHDLVRMDITEERLSSLSPQSKQLIRNLENEQPVVIEAFVSPSVPREYLQTKINLLSMLDEMDSLGGGKIQVTKHIIENFSPEAELAEETYDITSRAVSSFSRGTMTQEDIFMGIAVRCGLEKVIIPFLDKGIPPEYELIRSIATVSQQTRKRIGIVQTDAQLMGQFNFQSMSQSDDQQMIVELRKQYDIVEVDASQPITEQYDALLAVQPSSLGPEQMKNFIAAIKSGQPTAIFEDPFPAFWGNVAGTAQERQAPQNPMMMGRQPPAPPKGDINELWKLLGVDLAGEEIVWQNYNPYPKGRSFISPEWVFVGPGAGEEKAFNPESEISANLDQVLFFYPGSVRKLNSSELDFSRLAMTNNNTGIIEFDDIMNGQRRAAGSRPNLSLWEVPTGEQYAVAVHVRGKLPPEKSFLGDDADPTAQPPGSATGPETEIDANKQSNLGIVPDGTCADEDAATDKSGDEQDDSDPPHKEDEINVVVVADIDCLASDFFLVRAAGSTNNPDYPDWKMQNVAFVLNVLDSLAGDDRFIEIRKRRREHRTLETIEDRVLDARENAAKEREKFSKEFEKAQQEEQKKFDERIEAIASRDDLNASDKRQQVALAQREGQKRLEARVAQLQQQRDREIKRIERNEEMEVRSVQDSYKLRAVLIPPIPPLLLAFFVFFHRRQQEREGVSRSRLR